MESITLGPWEVEQRAYQIMLDGFKSNNCDGQSTVPGIYGGEGQYFVEQQSEAAARQDRYRTTDQDHGIGEIF